MTELRQKPQNSGFTLVELLVYIALFGVVSTVFYGLFITNLKSQSSQESKVEMMQDLRAAMNLMVKEIRLAGYNPTGVSGIGFLDDADDRYNTDGNSIHFTRDFSDTVGTGNPDGATDGPDEDINYFLYTSDGIQNIGRRTGSTGNPDSVSQNITVMTFSYTFADGGIGVPDETDGDTTNDRDDIRLVQISITAQSGSPDPMTKQVKTKTVTTSIRIRNAGV